MLSGEGGLGWRNLILFTFSRCFRFSISNGENLPILSPSLILSMGSVYARQYASSFPLKVVAMVGVDAAIMNPQFAEMDVVQPFVSKVREGLFSNHDVLRVRGACSTGTIAAMRGEWMRWLQ